MAHDMQPHVKSCVIPEGSRPRGCQSWSPLFWLDFCVQPYV